jgi:hypothetical protein
MFLRDKFYADFRTDFDAGLRTVLEGVAKISTASLARSVSADNHTDWSIRSGERDGQIGIFLTYVQQDKDQPYTVLTEIALLPNAVANERLLKVLKEGGKTKMRFVAMEALVAYLGGREDVRPVLDDEEEWIKHIEFNGAAQDEIYEARIGVHRLGQDTGHDILTNVTGLVRTTFEQMKSVLAVG